MVERVGDRSGVVHLAGEQERFVELGLRQAKVAFGEVEPAEKDERDRHPDRVSDLSTERKALLDENPCTRAISSGERRRCGAVKCAGQNLRVAERPAPVRRSLRRAPRPLEVASMALHPAKLDQRLDDALLVVRQTKQLQRLAVQCGCSAEVARAVGEPPEAIDSLRAHRGRQSVRSQEARFEPVLPSVKCPRASKNGWSEAARTTASSSSSWASIQARAARKLSMSAASRSKRRPVSGPPRPLSMCSASLRNHSAWRSRTCSELIALLEPLERVLADRLEHPEALVRVPDEALVDERLRACRGRRPRSPRPPRACSRPRRRPSRANSCCSSGVSRS